MAISESSSRVTDRSSGFAVKSGMLRSTYECPRERWPTRQPRDQGGHGGGHKGLWQAYRELEVAHLPGLEGMHAAKEVTSDGTWPGSR
jgi:hypothetical protein